MEEKKVRYKNLYNSLVLFAAEYNYLKMLDGPTFDIEFELPSEFDIGLTVDNIEFLFMNKQLTSELKNDLLDFRELVIAVPDSFWTRDELESNPMWNQVRNEANRLLEELGETGREYDFSMIKIVD